MLKKIYSNIPLFCTFFLSVFLVLSQENFQKDIFLYTLLLPIAYIVMSVFESQIVLKTTLVLQFFNVFNFLKYFLMPLLIINSQSIDVEGPSPNNLSYKLAIIILVLECVCVNFIKIRYYRAKIYIYYKKEKNVALINVLSVLLLLLYLLLFKLSIFLPSNIFQEFDFENIQEKSNDVALIFISWFKVIGFPIFVLFFYKFLSKSKSYYLSMILMLVFVYLNLGTRRWDILFFIIVGLKFLYDLYGKRTLNLIYPFSIVGFFIIMSISIYKFSWVLQGSDNRYLDMIKVFGEQFQPYFSGPSLVAQTIDMVEYHNFNESVSIKTFLNDIIGSIPGLSSIADQSDRINYYFNEYIFGSNTKDTSQIIPMSGIGYIFFGFFFSPIFTVFFTWLGFKLETLAIQSKYIINSYLLYYMSIWSVLAICFSSQIIWGSFIVIYIPLLIIQYFINTMKVNRV
nr:hypothetical protein [uncultured Flavobacterium sp.]